MPMDQNQGDACLLICLVDNLKKKSMKPKLQLIAICGFCSAMVFPSCKRKETTIRTDAIIPEDGSKAHSDTSAEVPPSVKEEPWFLGYSGEWVSDDGAQSAVVEKTAIRFKATKAWPELEGLAFELGSPPSFETKTGHYTLFTLRSEPDEIGVIKRDFTTNDHSSFTLYREGTKLARSRAPIPDAGPPPEILAILDQIRSIKAGERKNAVFKRLGLDFTDKNSPRYLDGQSGLGSTDELWKLDSGDEWMCRISYTRVGDVTDDEIVLDQFKLVRGFASDHGENSPMAPEIEYEVYPSYFGGKIITGPSDAHDAENITDGAAPLPE